MKNLEVPEFLTSPGTSLRLAGHPVAHPSCQEGGYPDLQAPRVEVRAHGVVEQPSAQPQSVQVFVRAYRSSPLVGVGWSEPVRFPFRHQPTSPYGDQLFVGLGFPLLTGAYQGKARFAVGSLAPPGICI